MINKGMSEADREKIYWWITAVLLLSTPGLAAVVAWNYSAVLFMDILQGMTYLLPLGIGSIVAVFFIEILFSKERKMLIERPCVTIEHRIRGDVKQWMERHFRVLKDEGFGCRIEEEGRQWHIGKNRGNGFTSGFTQHAFSGEVTVSADNFGPGASLTLTLEDSVIIETGEISKLGQLGCRLLGEKCSEVEKTMSLTLCSAVIMGVVTHALFYGEHFIDLHLIGFGASLLSMVEAVLMTVMIAAKPKELIGLRIAAAMIIAGGAPFFGLVIGKIMTSG